MSGVEYLKLICQFLDLNIALNDALKMANIADFDSFLNRYFKEYQRLAQSLSIEATVRIIYQIEGLKKKIFSLLFSKSIYPTILWLMGIVASIGFKFFILPNIASNFQVPYLLLFLSQLLFFLALLLIILLLLIFIVIILSRGNSIYLLLILNSRILNDSVIHSIINHVVVILLEEGFQELHSTKTLLDVMRKIPNKYIRSSIIFLLTDDLLKGKSLVDALDNSKLQAETKYALKMAIASNRFKDIMNTFKLSQQHLIKFKLNKICNVYLYSSYLYISMIVITMYQVILIPANSILGL